MSPIEGILLGVVQGATEFLPVSSSGHLILARELLGQNTAFGLAQDAVLQLATVLAVMVYFRHDLLRLCRALLAYVTRRPTEASARTELFALAVGTVPAIVAGLLLESAMETLFRSARLVAGVLVLGSLLFVAAEYVSSRFAARRTVADESTNLTVSRGFAIGLFQCLALVPGMSRSGATIAGGLFMGLTRERAARFSFLLSVPIILGSGLKKLAELGAGGALSADWLALGLGVVAAFATGIAVIHFLLRYLRHHSLMVFVWYRLILAAVIVLFVA